ncbi:MAG: MBL fold metallo-hydrolase [Hungatella sp.]|nr:MBL fold metallo-hydrolase [Hungatella sp.]
MRITWLGHSCFKVESGGYTLVIDPYEDGSVPGCLPVRETADEVLCSHEHFDHNFRGGVTLRSHGEPPVKTEVIAAWHDDQGGALRGSNKIHILDDGEVRIAHMGDLGCELEPEQLHKLKGLDGILIPVGGYYTIDAKQAKMLVDQIVPRVVVPMHYRGEGFGFDVLGTVEDFTKLCSDVREYDGHVLEITKDTKKQTAVLKIRR